MDAFLIEREQSVLSKLVAIGDARRGRASRCRRRPAWPIRPLCWRRCAGPLEILYERHYREYDTYFSWANAGQGQLRYREDEFLDANGGVSNVRYRLTLLGPRTRGTLRERRAAVAQPLPGAGHAKPPFLPRILQAGP